MIDTYNEEIQIEGHMQGHLCVTQNQENQISVSGGVVSGWAGGLF